MSLALISLPNGIYKMDHLFQVKNNIDEESEATLLTALTEILDNVDDENLSPFDTLPDSDLFSGQKGQEHSPVSLHLSKHVRNALGRLFFLYCRTSQ